MFTRVLYAIIIYTIIIIIIHSLRPQLLYNDNKFKEFGFEKHQTVVPIYILNIFLVVIIYIVVLSIDNFLCKINETNKKIYDLTNTIKNNNMSGI